MNAHRLRTTLRGNLVPLTAFSLLLVVALFGLAASSAHPQDDGVAASARNGREFKTEIPEHVPIRVKLKSEKSFKDSENKKWLREFEVEVKNTGSKPIYYVYLTLHMPDVRIGGILYGLSVRYGRSELLHPETAVEPGDVPIMPGESATLKVNAQAVKNYEYSRDELRQHGDPKRVFCWVKVIKFGDGTALWGKDGNSPLPEVKSKSSTAPKQKNGAEGCRSSPAVGKMDAPGGLFKVSNSWQPASILRAYLLEPVDAPALAAAPDDCGCHSVPGCMWGRVEFRNCTSCESELAVVFAGGCGNSGRCLRYITKTITCPAESDPTLKCTWDEYTSETCYLSDPTPTPTPEPSPSPDPSSSPSPTPPSCPGQKPADCCECSPPPPGTAALTAALRLDGGARAGV